MPDEPIRERILQDCEASLRRINGTGPFHFALAAIARGKPVPAELDKFPAAFLTEGDETVIQDTNLLSTRLLPITIETWLQSLIQEEGLATLANRMLADLERALLADPTRGGLAIRTELVGTAIVADESPGVLASAQSQFEITYWTVKGNPASRG